MHLVHVDAIVLCFTIAVGSRLGGSERIVKHESLANPPSVLHSVHKSHKQPEVALLPNKRLQLPPAWLMASSAKVRARVYIMK